MEFLRHLLENKLGQALGLPVTMAGFSASPFTGRVEVTELNVGTMLSVQKIVAKIAVAKALKREISIQSLVIESPVITYHRIPPQPPPRPAKAITNPGKGEPQKGWTFEAQQVQLSRGQITISIPKANGYRFALDGLDGSIRLENGTYELTATVRSVGRQDELVDLGAARLAGRMAGEAIEAQLQIGTIVDVRGQSTAMRSGPWNGSLELTLAMATLLRLLPNTVKLPITSASGEATLSAAATVDPDRRVKVERFALSTRDMSVK